MGAAGYLIDFIRAVNCFDPDKPCDSKGKVTKALIMFLLHLGVVLYWW